MRYYLIVGEASGDLHASNLMKAILEEDHNASFRFLGGDLMKAVGGTCVKHYKELAYMGFIPVLMHLRTIFRNMEICEEDIVAWKPDVVILVDYPGFNLKVAKYLKKHTHIPVFYYISPKIWAWKEYRIKNIKRDVDELFSILPFEVPFYQKHHYQIHYIGNPCVDAVASYRDGRKDSFKAFAKDNGLDESKPVLALLPGSRKQEIKDNLELMLEASSSCKDDYQIVLGAAPGIAPSIYQQYKERHPWVHIVHQQTYRLLSHAEGALVVSGTSTLETCLFRVPQVVCYYTPIGKIISFLKKKILSVRFISLVNLIADREVVKELVADQMKESIIRSELNAILYDTKNRQRMLADYDEIINLLGEPGASQHAAQKMVDLLKTTYHQNQ